MKPHSEMNEGPDAFDRFRKAMKTIVGVRKSAVVSASKRIKKKAAKRKA